ncbi:MAG: hypothetical protein ACE5H0_11575 [Bacteroidota bacterium]
MAGFKTIIVAVLSFLVFALGWEPLKQFIDPQTIAIVMAVLMAILRFLTKGPVFKKPS